MQQLPHLRMVLPAWDATTTAAAAVAAAAALVFTPVSVIEWQVLSTSYQQPLPAPLCRLALNSISTCRWHVQWQSEGHSMGFLGYLSCMRGVPGMHTLSAHPTPLWFEFCTACVYIHRQHGRCRC